MTDEDIKEKLYREAIHQADEHVLFIWEQLGARRGRALIEHMEMLGNKLDRAGWQDRPTRFQLHRSEEPK